MTKKHISIDQIGSELVETSKKEGQDSLPMSTRLFPYIHVASRRMSLRNMSAWLKDTHGVNISPGQISRALREPQLHLERLAEFIAPLACCVGMLAKAEPYALLFDRIEEDGPYYIDQLCEDAATYPEHEGEELYLGELYYLASVWRPIPYEVKMLLETYLSPLLRDDDPDFPPDMP